jgi:hypothetical protein
VDRMVLPWNGAGLSGPLFHAGEDSVRSSCNPLPMPAPMAVPAAARAKANSPCSLVGALRSSPAGGLVVKSGMNTNENMKPSARPISPKTNAAVPPFPASTRLRIQSTIYLLPSAVASREVAAADAHRAIRCA